MQDQNSDAAGVRRGLWNEAADREAGKAIDHGLLQALAALSPALSDVGESDFEETVARAARLNLAAVQRVLELLQQLSVRLSSELERAQLEMRVEQAICDAADALPEPSEESPPSQRRTR